MGLIAWADRRYLLYLTIVRSYDATHELVQLGGSVGSLATKLAANWKRALARPSDEHGYIGSIPYASLLRALVLVAIVARILSFNRQNTSTWSYTLVLVLCLIAAAAALERSTRAYLRRWNALIVLDIAVVSLTYALTGSARSDTYLLFALPLLTAAEEYSINGALFVLSTVTVTFGAILYSLESASHQRSQWGALFFPRTIFFVVLMASWASAVRGLRIKEKQLSDDLVDFNNRLSQLSTVPKIIDSASLSAAELTGADDATIILSGAAGERWPESNVLINSLNPEDRDRIFVALENLRQSPDDPITFNVSAAAAGAPRSILIVPISGHGYHFGALLLATRSDRQLRSRSMTNLARAIGSQTATALDRVQVGGLWRGLVNALSQFAETMPATTISLTAELDDLLEQVTELGFTYAAVSVVDEYRGRVEMIRGLNVPPGWIRRSHYYVTSDDILAYIVRTGDTVVLEGWDDRFNREIYDRFEHEKLARMFCPLIANGVPIGVLETGIPKELKAKVLSDHTVARVKRLCTERGSRIEPHLPQSTLRQLVEIGISIMKADAAIIYVLRGEEELLCAGAGKATLQFIRGNADQLKDLADQAKRLSEASRIYDADTIERYCPWLPQLGVHSCAVFPVSLKPHDISGFLFLGFWRPHYFTHFEREIDVIYSRQIEVVIRNYVELIESRTAAERAWSLSRLQTVIQSVTARFNLTDLLSRIAQDLLSTLDADVVVIHEYRQETNLFMPPVTKGILLHPEAIGGQPQQSSVIVQLLHQPRSVFQEDLRQNPLFGYRETDGPRGFSVREGIVSAAALRLVSEDPDEVVGLVFVNYRSRKKFTREDRQAMNALASSAAIAIRTARERERTQRSVTRLERELTAVSRADQAVLTDVHTASPREVLTLLLKDAIEITGAEEGAVLWRDGDQFTARSGVTARPASPDIRIHSSDKLVQSILAERNAVVIPDMNYSRALSRPLLSSAARSQVITPLFDADTLLGVIVLEHNEMAKFSKEDRRFLEAMAVQARMALQTIAISEQQHLQIRPQRALTSIATRIQNVTQPLETQLRLLLTGITAREGIGFSRAILLSFDEEGRDLRGLLAIGALSASEANEKWEAAGQKTGVASPDDKLTVLLDEAEHASRESKSKMKEDPLTRRILDLSFTVDSLPGSIARALQSSCMQQVGAQEPDPWREQLNSADAQAPYTFACCPLIWGKEKLGVLIVDDRFLPTERDRFSENRLASVNSFAEMISLVILNTRLRDRLRADAFRDLEHQLRTPLRSAQIILNQIDSHNDMIDSDLDFLRGVLAKAARVSRSVRLYADLAANLPIRREKMQRLTARLVGDQLWKVIHESALQGRNDLRVCVDDLSFIFFERTTILFDVVLFEQVLGNVIDNVYSYAFAHQDVWIWLEPSERDVILRIENAGALTEAEAHKCLQRGIRGSQAELVTGEGSGLGLWIVDRIMQAHAGSVRLRADERNKLVTTELLFVGE
jgi:GAF domain-containing protein